MRMGIVRAGLAGVLAVGGCTCGSGAVQVSGETPYTRCRAADPSWDDTRTLGALKLHAEDRRLDIEGLPRPLRVAVFSGPGFGPPPSATQVAELAAAEPHLALMLGGLGDDAETAAATAAALAGLPCPTLVVAGGRDEPGRIAKALAAQPSDGGRVLDVSAFDTVALGRDVLIPVAGSYDGRYAVGKEACGHGLDDLKGLAAALGAPTGAERRWLAAWEAPGGGGPLAVARTDTGVDTGSVDLEELASRVQAAGGLFAWPAVQAGRPRAGGGTRAVAVGEGAADLRMVVPRLTGAALERADGSLAPAGFAVAVFGADGLTIETMITWKTTSDDS